MHAQITVPRMYDVIFSYPDYSLIRHYRADPWDKRCPDNRGCTVQYLHNSTCISINFKEVCWSEGTVEIHVHVYIVIEGVRYLCVLLDGGGSVQEANDQADKKINHSVHYTYLVVEGKSVHLDEVHQMPVRDSDSP